MAPCCTCNGKNAVCKRCVCVQSERPCVSYLPLRERRCVNTLQHRQQPLDGFVKKGVHDKSDNLNGDHMSFGSVADFDVNTSSQVPTNSSDSNSVSLAADPTPLDNFVDCDSLMRKAYGATLIQSGSCSHSHWHRRWKSVVHHSGNHYVLPGGPTGRRYVDLLTEEVQHLAVRNFPSERVLVFSSVMLQRNRMVHKGADIRRLLDWHVDQWRDGHFDLLVQEADCCDSGLKHSRRANVDEDDNTRIFSRLILQGKVKAAVRWATERTRGELLMPTDDVDNGSGATVLDVLRQKHPSAQPPGVPLWCSVMIFRCLRM